MGLSWGNWKEWTLSASVIFCVKKIIFSGRKYALAHTFSKLSLTELMVMGLSKGKIKLPEYPHLYCHGRMI